MPNHPPLMSMLDLLILAAFAVLAVLDLVYGKYFFGITWTLMFIAGLLMHAQYKKHHHLPRPSLEAYIIYLVLIIGLAIMIIRFFMIAMY